VLTLDCASKVLTLRCAPLTLKSQKSSFEGCLAGAQFELRKCSVWGSGWPLWGVVLATLGCRTGHFGVSGWPLWGVSVATLGCRAGHFEVSSSTGHFGGSNWPLWRLELAALGCQGGHFGVSSWPLWGVELATLGCQGGHFGVSYWPLWGVELATLGCRTGHFGVSGISTKFYCKYIQINYLHSLARGLRFLDLLTFRLC
jgi:hypothetical protein